MLFWQEALVVTERKKRLVVVVVVVVVILGGEEASDRFGIVSDNPFLSFFLFFSPGQKGIREISREEKRAQHPAMQPGVLCSIGG